MNREERRTTGSPGTKGEKEKMGNPYVPVRCSETKYKPRNDIPPRAGDIYRSRRTCKMRWQVPVVESGAVVMKLFRKRKMAMRRRHLDTDIPRLVRL